MWKKKVNINKHNNSNKNEMNYKYYNSNKWMKLTGCWRYQIHHSIVLLKEVNNKKAIQLSATYRLLMIYNSPFSCYVKEGSELHTEQFN